MHGLDLFHCFESAWERLGICISFSFLQIIATFVAVFGDWTQDLRHARQALSLSYVPSPKWFYNIATVENYGSNSLNLQDVSSTACQWKEKPQFHYCSSKNTFAVCCCQKLKHHSSTLLWVKIGFWESAQKPKKEILIILCSFSINKLPGRV